MLSFSQVTGTIFLAIALLGHANAAEPALQAEQVVTVDVTGYGVSVQQAREDAIRKAMQAALPQVILADRRISMDEVVEDSVLSTMRGFISRFEELEIERVDGETRLHSRVEVATQGIASFLGGDSSASSVDGKSIFAEAERIAAQQEALTAIFIRALRGFPSHAFDTRVEGFQPIEEDPDWYRLSFSIQLNADWAKSVSDTFAAVSMSTHDFSWPHLASRLGTPEGDNSVTSRESACRSNLTRAFFVKPPAEFCGPAGAAMANSMADGESGGFAVCITEDLRARCSVLPFAKYGKLEIAGLQWSDLMAIESYLPEARYLVVGSDSFGKSTATQDCCKLHKADGGLTLSGSRHPYNFVNADRLPFSLPMRPRPPRNNGDGLINFIYSGVLRGWIKIHREEFDLVETREMAVFPVLLIDNFKGEKIVLTDVADADELEPLKKLEQSVLSGNR